MELLTYGWVGHFINNCPTNGDPSFDKVKKSTGIPKIFLKPVEGQTVSDMWKNDIPGTLEY